jgi:hypothetical protein
MSDIQRKLCLLVKPISVLVKIFWNDQAHEAELKHSVAEHEAGLKKRYGA